MKTRIAFDLDETLGTPIVDSESVIGFRLRDGAVELLNKLARKYELVVWTVGKRSYVDKVMSFGLAPYFAEIYSWEELSYTWKDVRKINADFLIDDNPDHCAAAKRHGLEARYIVVAADGSEEDYDDPLLWVRQVEAVLLGDQAKASGR